VPGTPTKLRGADDFLDRHQLDLVLDPADDALDDLLALAREVEVHFPVGQDLVDTDRFADHERGVIFVRFLPVRRPAAPNFLDRRLLEADGVSDVDAGSLVELALILRPAVLRGDLIRFDAIDRVQQDFVVMQKSDIYRNSGDSRPSRCAWRYAWMSTEPPFTEKCGLAAPEPPVGW
jgi:hypothetical protein